MLQPARFRDQREHRWHISIPTQEDPTLVICPKCQQMAKVFPKQEQPEQGYTMKLVCTKCPFNQEKTSAQGARGFAWYSEDPTDSYFGYHLWLRIDCCGHSLWVFNKRHLDFLFNFVSAGLRERKKDASGWANSSLASRLPKWLQSAKNRDKILVALSKLKKAGNYEP